MDFCGPSLGWSAASAIGWLEQLVRSPVLQTLLLSVTLVSLAIASSSATNAGQPANREFLSNPSSEKHCALLLQGSADEATQYSLKLHPRIERQLSYVVDQSTIPFEPKTVETAVSLTFNILRGHFLIDEIALKRALEIPYVEIDLTNEQPRLIIRNDSRNETLFHFSRKLHYDELGATLTYFFLRVSSKCLAAHGLHDTSAERHIGAMFMIEAVCNAAQFDAVLCRKSDLHTEIKRLNELQDRLLGSGSNQKRVPNQISQNEMVMRLQRLKELWCGRHLPNEKNCLTRLN